MQRRAFLAGGGLALALGATACATGSGARAEARFVHGVASGDPGPDRVVIWTRLDAAADGERVEWIVALDARLRRVVRRGELAAQAVHDYCCKVDVDGLVPGTTYFYAFRAHGGHSATGRTRTLPQGEVERLRFAVASCANIQDGAFAAYACIARMEALDAVLHLGDYIYEYGDRPGARVPLDPPHEILALADYRRRYAFYRSDPALQACHRMHAFIAVWDDHESANNAWRDGAGNHDPAREGPWSERRTAAIRAWREWMPVRDAAPDAPIYRAFRFGKLADLMVLDTRLEGRARQAPSARAIAGDPQREMLGAAQEHWLFDALEASVAHGTRWRLLGQQVVFAPMGSVNPDQWDGYPAARQRILDHLREASIDNVVILSGDIHSSWALDVTADPYDASVYDPATGRGAQAVEFVTPGIASRPLGDYLREHAPDAYRHLLDSVPRQPHLRVGDYSNRGFLSVELSAERVEAAWHFVAAPLDPQSPLALRHRAAVRAGANHLEQPHDA